MYGYPSSIVVDECDDTILKVNSVQEGTFASGSTIDINITDGTDPVTPDAVIVTGNTVEIQVPAASTPIGATLMKTGQTTSYRTGDDGDIEAGRATNFTTLATNNPFGNTNRFTDELGGQTYTNNIVIDWSTYDSVGGTVLGYRRTRNGSYVTWASAIDGALAVSIGSYTTGWRLPNIKEIENIMNYSAVLVYNYAPININADTNIWSSTTSSSLTTSARGLFSTGTGNLGAVSKTAASAEWIPCRTFTVSGTTLS